MPAKHGAVSVYLFALGYFLCYAPYSALTKALTSGLTGSGQEHSGLSLLPVTTVASGVSMVVVLSLLRWWPFATQVQVGSLRLPRPGLYTGLSGLATAAIIVTTTLAYTFDGVSIPLVMLLMRGGVLLLAPLVDVLAKRTVRWFSYAALVMSAVALLDAVFGAEAMQMPFWCVVDIAVYLAAYFVRLQFMSRLAKSADADSQKRYFVEEQMVAAPAAILGLCLLALVGEGPAFEEIRRGFTEVLGSADLWLIVLVGVLSQGTGIFGGLVLLDARENTFCVPLNRASSVLAGVLAALFLTTLGQRAPSGAELLGAALLVSAIVVLWAGPRIDARRAAKLPSEPSR